MATTMEVANAKDSIRFRPGSPWHWEIILISPPVFDDAFFPFALISDSNGGRQYNILLPPAACNPVLLIPSVY